MSEAPAILSYSKARERELRALAWDLAADWIERAAATKAIPLRGLTLDDASYVRGFIHHLIVRRLRVEANEKRSER